MTRMAQRAGAYPDPPIDCVNIQLLVRGSGPATVDLGHGPWTGTPRPGQVFIAGPNVRTDYRVGFDHTLIAIGVDLSLMEEVCAGAGTPMPGGLVGPCQGPISPGVVEALVHLLGHPAPLGMARSDRAVNSLLASLSWAVATTETATATADGREVLDEERFMAARKVRRQSRGSATSVAALARDLGVDRHRLGRATRQLFGVSPSALLRQWQLEHVRHLLGESQQTLSQVASLAGFSDQAHMGRVVRRELGMTPGQLRDALAEV